MTALQIIAPVVLVLVGAAMIAGCLWQDRIQKRRAQREQDRRWRALVDLVERERFLIDLVWGSWPCEPFSVARRLGEQLATGVVLLGKVGSDMSRALTPHRYGRQRP